MTIHQFNSLQMVNIHFVLMMVNVSCFPLKRIGTGQHSKHLIRTSTLSHFKRYFVPSTMNLAM